MTAKSFFLSFVLIASVAAFAGCGSSTLSEQARAGLREQAVNLQTQLEKAGEQATACATEQKIKKEGLKGIGECLGAALDKSSKQELEVSAYVKKLADSASGDCQDKLNNFSDALNQTANTLGDASALAKKGEIDKIDKELQGVSQDQVDVQVAGRDADKACGG